MVVVVVVAVSVAAVVGDGSEVRFGFRQRVIISKYS